MQILYRSKKSLFHRAGLIHILARGEKCFFFLALRTICETHLYQANTHVFTIRYVETIKTNLHK